MQFYEEDRRSQGNQSQIITTNGEKTGLCKPSTQCRLVSDSRRMDPALVTHRETRLSNDFGLHRPHILRKQCAPVRTAYANYPHKASPFSAGLPWTSSQQYS